MIELWKNIFWVAFMAAILLALSVGILATFQLARQILWPWLVAKVKLFILSRKRPVSDSDNMTLWLLVYHKCPDCLRDTLQYGPEGGSSQNIRCTVCNAHFNASLLGTERIPEVRFKPKPDPNPIQAAINNIKTLRPYVPDSGVNLTFTFLSNNGCPPSMAHSIIKTTTELMKYLPKNTYPQPDCTLTVGTSDEYIRMTIDYNRKRFATFTWKDSGVFDADISDEEFTNIDPTSISDFVGLVSVLASRYDSKVRIMYTPPVINGNIEDLIETLENTNGPQPEPPKAKMPEIDPSAEGYFLSGNDEPD